MAAINGTSIEQPTHQEVLREYVSLTAFHAGLDTSLIAANHTSSPGRSKCPRTSSIMACRKDDDLTRKGLKVGMTGIKRATGCCTGFCDYLMKSNVIGAATKRILCTSRHDSTFSRCHTLTTVMPQNLRLRLLWALLPRGS